MTVQTKAVIKTYFERGDKPLQSQFVDLIDSYQDFSVALSALSVNNPGNFGLVFIQANTTAAASDLLNLGTASTRNTGTSGATVPLLNGNNTNSGSCTFSSLLTGSAGYTSFTATIADDSVATYTTPSATVSFLMTSNGVSSTQPRGLFHARTSTAFLERLDTAPTQTSIALTTGVLTGTTGSDGNFTISAAADGKLYFENRSGGSRVISILVINM